MTMTREDIFSKINELTERVSSLEKMCDSFTQSNKMCNMSTPPNKRWRAAKDCMYFYIDSEDEVCSSLENGAITDKLRYETGNYFKSMDDAGFEIEHLKVVAELREWSTPVDDFDWDNNAQRKYMILLINNHLRTDFFSSCQISSGLYFKSEEIAKEAIRVVGEDRIIKYYFRRGVMKNE